MSTLVQYMHGESFFHRLDPRSKIISMLLMAFLLLAVDSLLVAAAILVTMLLLWCAAGLSLTVLKELTTPVIGLAGFLLIVQALLYPGDTALVQPIVPPSIPLIGGRGAITLEGILFAIVLSLRLLAMVVLLPLVTMTTPLHIFTLGLVRLGLPYRLAYTMTTALNLIPILQTEAHTIADAQKLRAFRVFERGSFLEKLKAYPALVTPLIIGAMRRAQLIAVAMDSRAFGASSDRTYIHEIRMRQPDWAFLTLSTVFVAAAGIGNHLIG